MNANAYQSNDGNTDSRWGSNGGTDTEWYQIKWPIAQTFNTITIMYEGAMNSANAPSLEYIIQTSNDGENWTDRATCTTKLNGGEWLSIPLGENVTASYVRFQGVKRGNYGYSFWELGVYKLGEALALSSLQITPDKTDIILNSTASFTAVGKDQLGGIFNTGVLTWTSSDTSVGTVADGVFTAIAAGTTNVTASNSTSTVISNEVTMTAIDAVKIDLATNNDYRIYPIEETSNNGKINAFDSDLGSLWVLHGSTAADESSRTYNTGFIADLGGVYDITNVSIKFEGACSQAFTLSFAGEDGVFGAAVYNGGHNTTETHTETFSGETVTNARYVKFLSTKAQSQHGVKIMDFTIDGVEKSTVTDTENPTITTISEGTITHNSITLNVTGNDNDSKYLMYKVEYSGKTSWISGTANAATPAIFEGLLPGKEYSFTITAYDSKGNNVNTNKVVSTTGDALTLPVATKDADDVKTIFGQYGKTSGYNVYRASEFAETGWSHNALQTNGNNNNVEMTFTAKDVSDMEYLHLDIYAPSAIPMCVFLQDGSWKGIDIEDGIPADEWKQVDIPMSFFKKTCERPMTALTNLLICKNVANTTTHEGHGGYSEPYPYFIIGNIYFWKTPAVDEVKPVMVSATLASKTYNSATLTLNATDNSGKVKFHIVDATNNINVTTGLVGQGADFEYTVTGLTPETTYNFTVTAEDAADNVSTNNIKMTAFTTDAKPMSGDFTTTTYNSSNPDVNGKVINYTCTFTQSGTDVTVTFTYTTPENILGLVPYNVTANGGENIGTSSYKWPGCSAGNILHAHSSWAAASGGLAETKEFYYVVAGENAGLVKMPADANDINEILGTGTVSATAFKELTTIEEKAYDLTNLKVTSAVALEANNKNAVFIVKEDQKTNLAGTNNLLVWDEGNSRYASDKITITDQPSAFNLFASNLPIYTTNAKYVRKSVGANQYFTVALPFAGNTPENFSAYTAGVASANVTFTKVASGEMAKANPYVIHNVNESEADFIVTATDVNAVLDFTETKPDNSCMESVFTIQNTSSLTTDIYALMADPNDAGKVVFHAAKGVTLIPFRAIFRGSSLATARAIFLDGETTKIGAIDVDGKIETGAIYNLAGQRVQNPTKGIYIINGKKVVLK